MTAEHEMELWSQYKTTGDQQALSGLLTTYRPLMERRVKQQFSRANIPETAIVAKGLSLTVDAINTYDPTRGRALKSHAFEYWKKLHRFVDQQKQIARISESQSTKIAPYMEATRQLSESMGRDPSSQELADHLGWGIRDINKLKREITFEDPIASWGGMKEIARPQDESDVVQYVYQFDLTPEEKYIFEHSMGYMTAERMPASQIAANLKILPSQVSQRKRTIANKLKKRLEEASVHKIGF